MENITKYLSKKCFTEKTIKEIERLLKKGKYRNKSHIIEEAIKLLGRKEKYGK